MHCYLAPNIVRFHASSDRRDSAFNGLGVSEATTIICRIVAVLCYQAPRDKIDLLQLVVGFTFIVEHILIKNTILTFLISAHRKLLMSALGSF